MRSYNSSMLTPSPLRRKAFALADSDTSLEGELGLETPIDFDDIFSQSPYRPTAPLKSFDAHLRSVAGPSKLASNSVPFTGANDFENDTRIFLSTSSTSSTPGPKAAQQRAAQRTRRAERPAVPLSQVTPAPARRRTPSKQSHTLTRPRSTVETSTRRRSPPPPLPRPLSIAQLRPRTSTPTPNYPPPPPLPLSAQRTPMSRPPTLSVNTTGMKRKSADSGSYSKGMLTPLATTKTSGEGSLDRLAPLPAPKFRVPADDDDTDGFLRGHGTMDKLCLDERRKGMSDEGMGEEEAVDVSPGGHIVKRRAKSRPVSWDLKQRGGSAQVCGQSHDVLCGLLFMLGHSKHR